MQDQNNPYKLLITLQNIEERADNHLDINNTTPKIISTKKIFKKDHNCPHVNCVKKYSSKIALNAHIKKKHHIDRDS